MNGGVGWGIVCRRQRFRMQSMNVCVGGRQDKCLTSHEKLTAGRPTRHEILWVIFSFLRLSARSAHCANVYFTGVSSGSQLARIWLIHTPVCVSCSRKWKLRKSQNRSFYKKKTCSATLKNKRCFGRKRQIIIK